MIPKACPRLDRGWVPVFGTDHAPPLRSPAGAQRLHQEVAVRIGPGPNRHPADAARQRGKGFHRVFVAALGVDGLAFAERDRAAADLDALVAAACEMHLD